MSYDQVVTKIKGAGASMRCSKLSSLLKSLGFEIRGGDGPGHKVFKHPSIPSFHGGSFNCGHGKNPEVKRCYLRNIGKNLDEFEDEIKEYLQKT